MAQPLEGKIVQHRPEGIPRESMEVVGNIMDFLIPYGLELNIWDHFYPVNDDQCPAIDGLPANVWWERYVTQREGQVEKT